MKHETIQSIREKKPLILCLTNSVTENFCANVLLAVGASPIMSHAPQELDSLMNLASALVINIGTLTDGFVEMLQVAVKIANDKKRVIILDPVGAGASDLRTSAARFVINNSEQIVLKCNASELLSLVGDKSNIRGVDSGDSVNSALVSAQSYIQQTSINHIILTGKEDYLVSEKEVVKNTFGSELMAQVTGMGCALSACLAAAYSISTTPSIAMFDALQHYTIAGEKAAKNANGPGSFSVCFLDELSK